MIDKLILGKLLLAASLAIAVLSLGACARGTCSGVDYLRCLAKDTVGDRRSPRSRPFSNWPEWPLSPIGRLLAVRLSMIG